MFVCSGTVQGWSLVMIWVGQETGVHTLILYFPAVMELKQFLVRPVYRAASSGVLIFGCHFCPFSHHLNIQLKDGLTMTVLSIPPFR